MTGIVWHAMSYQKLVAKYSHDFTIVFKVFDLANDEHVNWRIRENGVSFGITDDCGKLILNFSDG